MLRQYHETRRSRSGKVSPRERIAAQAYGCRSSRTVMRRFSNLLKCDVDQDKSKLDAVNAAQSIDFNLSESKGAMKVRWTQLLTFAILPGPVIFAGLCYADDGHKEQVLAWRAEHEAKYASETGWLAITNLDWLREGENRFGASPENAIVLPADSVPNVAGSISVADDRIEIIASDDVKLSVNGSLVKSAILQIDRKAAESNSTDEVMIADRLRFQLIRRSGKLAIRVRDRQSRSLLDFKGMNWFPVDEACRVEAVYRPYEPEKTLSIVNSRGDSVEAEVPGFVEFSWNGKSYRLDAQRESDTEMLIVFADLTNKTTTYQPGRFLNAVIPSDGKLILDFNLAYNPPCAFSRFTLCPMPPKQNRLPIAIEAGEKRY